MTMRRRTIAACPARIVSAPVASLTAGTEARGLAPRGNGLGRFDAAVTLAVARSDGAAVGVAAARTDRTRTFANAVPDGSWTLEQYAGQVRVRRGDGSRVAVDPTLRPVAGGLRPVASLADVRFSAGGSRPCTLGFGVAGALTLRRNPQNRVEAAGGARPAVSFGEALTWDSHRGCAAPADSSSIAAPGEHASRAPTAVRTAGGQLVIEPDRALPIDPDAVVPLYLDLPYATGVERFALTNGKSGSSDRPWLPAISYMWLVVGVSCIPRRRSVSRTGPAPRSGASWGQLDHVLVGDIRAR
jgi:hypothetical protein